MEEKKINKSIAFSIVAAFILAVIVLGATFAYFRAAGQTDVQEITTANLKMGFVAGEWIRVNEGLMPINDTEADTKAAELPFTITNTGDEHMDVTIKLTDITMSEELKDLDFRWGLFNEETGNAVSRGVFADIGTSNELTIYADTIIDAAEPDITNSYVLRIWLHDDGTLQDSLMGKSFSARVKATAEAIEYTPESCFTFDSSTGTISDYDYDTCGTNIVIPKTIGGVTVTEIGDSAFANDTVEGVGKITKLILPGTIETIGVLVIGDIGYSNSSITIPEGVTTISAGAFESNGEFNVTQIFLPDTITTFGGFNMDISSNVRTIVIPNSVTYFTDISFGSGIHNFILTDGISGLRGSYALAPLITNTLEIPSSVTHIDSGFFGYAEINEIIVRGKTEAPEGFGKDWNCYLTVDGMEGSECEEYYKTTYISE